MKHTLTLILLLLFGAGCATTESINTNYAQIDYSDGISKKEAIAIVQKMYIDGDIPKEVQSKVGLNYPDASLHKQTNEWWVLLTDRSWDVFHSYTYRVILDAKTGAVIEQELSRSNTPIVVPIPELSRVSRTV